MAHMLPNPDATPRRLSRAAAVQEMAAAIEPGDHVTFIGPTGRGKSTLLAKVLPKVVHDRVIVLTPKGADPAFAHLGDSATSWPPRRRSQSLVERLRVAWAEPATRDEEKLWRIEVPIRQATDLRTVVAPIYTQVLSDTLARPESSGDSVMVVLDDSRLVSEYMKLQELVVTNMLVGRSKRVSFVNMYQAPRWVPREGLDQAVHVVMWQNRDRDVMKRLGEIADVDPAAILSIMGGLGFHESLWIDARADTLTVVGK